MREEPPSEKFLIDYVENGCNLILMMDRSLFLQPGSGRRAQSGGRSMRQMRKIIMPIRVRHRDKLGARVQPSKDQELSAQLATGSIACYADKNAKIRILRGSG